CTLRLMPGIPYWPVNYGSGALGVSSREFLIATVVSALPGQVSLIAIGAFIADPSALSGAAVVISWVVVIALTLVADRRWRATRVFEDAPGRGSRPGHRRWTAATPTEHLLIPVPGSAPPGGSASPGARRPLRGPQRPGRPRGCGMSTTTEASGGFSPRVVLQKVGTSLSNMVMPNIPALIAWGLLTAFFIPDGWTPNEPLASVVGPMIHYLLPLLIANTGGRMVYEARGAVVGVIATMGVIAGSDWLIAQENARLLEQWVAEGNAAADYAELGEVHMFIGAMIMA